MSEPNPFELSPAVREQLEKFRSDHEGDAVGAPATRLLFEDERVRIWDMRLAPGEGSPLHRHEHDYYLVMQEGDMIGGVSPASEDTPPFAMALPPGGATVGIERGALEWSVNVGQESFYEIVVELKQDRKG